MPYKSKAERESENWMTLPEAINHICKIENIPEMKARKQLVAALVDGELWPLRWQRERGDRARPFGRSAVPSPTDAPPRGPDWSGAKIRWKTSRVHDDWGEFKQGQWRMLLIHRHRVINLWPPVQSTKYDYSDSKKVVPSVSRKRGRAPEKTERIKDEMRKNFRERKFTAAHLEKMKEEVLARQYSASRDTCRKARKAVLSEPQFVGNS